MKISNTILKLHLYSSKINIVFITALFAIFIISSSYIYSYPSGVSGYTLKSGTSGCTSCHGSSSSTVSVAISGPSTLKPGETGSYSVTISGGAGTGVGVDIASSNGTLATVDNNLKILNAELTHTSAKSFSGGKYVFSFKYTAPNSSGTQTLYATGVSSKPQWNFAPNFCLTVQSASTDVENNQSAVVSYSLLQNYPNPFNPATLITYTLPMQSSVKLVVFNSIGQEVRTLVNGTQTAGNHQVTFDASGLTSGIYFYSIEAKSEEGNGSFKYVRKMSLMK